MTTVAAEEQMDAVYRRKEGWPETELYHYHIIKHVNANFGKTPCEVFSGPSRCQKSEDFQFPLCDFKMDERTHTDWRPCSSICSRCCVFPVCMRVLPASQWTEAVKPTELPAFLQSCTDTAQLLPEHTGQTDHELLQLRRRHLRRENRN